MMLDRNEIRELVLEILKPDDRTKQFLWILFIASFLASVFVFLYNMAFSSRGSAFVLSVIMISMLFIIAFIGFIRTIIIYLVAKYFKHQTNEFEKRMHKGFSLMLTSSIITLIYNLIQQISQNTVYFIIVRRWDIQLFRSYRTWESNISLMSRIAIACIGLYGALIFLSGLKYYKGNDERTDLENYEEDISEK